VLLCVPAKAKEKAVAIATDIPPADGGAGPALATTANQDFTVSALAGTGPDVSNASAQENVCARCKEHKAKSARYKILM